MKLIPLTQGKTALVDDEDYKHLVRWKWFASCNRGTCYALRASSAGLILMHREIMKAKDGDELDHINGDALDNRRQNLRLCNRTQNLANARKARSWSGRPTSSRFKGVSWYRNNHKWEAELFAFKKRVHLGYFDSEIEAAKAYDRAARQHFGEFAKTNFPLEASYVSHEDLILEVERQRQSWLVNLVNGYLGKRSSDNTARIIEELLE